MSAPLILAAEHTTNPGRGVWVLLETWSFRSESGVLIPSEFVIRTSTGYRAVLPACMSDRCTGGPADVVLLRCVKPLDGRGQHVRQSVDAWCEHVRTHCHGPHIEHAEIFAAEVAATYGSADKPETSQTSLTGLLAHPKRIRSTGVKAWAQDPYAMALEGR